MDIKRYIPQLYVEGKAVACGVFLNNLFITDAHVISPCLHHYVEFNGKRIFLDRKNEIYFKCENKDPYGYDLAVYKLEDVVSPCSLAENLPDSGKTLTLPYYDVLTSEFKITSATTLDMQEGNYFAVNTLDILAVGNSGSPILCGNKVYGLLNAGKPGENFCVFLSSKSIFTQIQHLL